MDRMFEGGIIRASESIPTAYEREDVLSTVTGSCMSPRGANEVADDTLEKKGGKKLKILGLEKD